MVYIACCGAVGIVKCAPFSPRVARNSAHAQTGCTRPSFSPSRLKEKLGPGNEASKLANGVKPPVSLVRFYMVKYIL